LDPARFHFVARIVCKFYKATEWIGINSFSFPANSKLMQLPTQIMRIFNYLRWDIFTLYCITPWEGFALFDFVHTDSSVERA
jgi:hypothetical protein